VGGEKTKGENTWRGHRKAKSLKKRNNTKRDKFDAPTGASRGGRRVGGPALFWVFFFGNANESRGKERGGGKKAGVTGGVCEDREGVSKCGGTKKAQGGKKKLRNYAKPPRDYKEREERREREKREPISNDQWDRNFLVEKRDALTQRSGKNVGQENRDKNAAQLAKGLEFETGNGSVAKKKKLTKQGIGSSKWGEKRAYAGTN